MTGKDRSGLLALAALDVAGASLFALGLAGAIAALARGSGFAMAALEMLAGGVAARVLAGRLTASAGSRLGQRLAAQWRARVLPTLLGGRAAARLAPGEAAALGTDHIAAIEAYGARFLPAKLSASAGPMLVLVPVALASWVAALIMLATMVPFVIGMIVAGTAARRASDQQLAAFSTLSAIFVDRVAHLPLIRQFAAEARAGGEVAEATEAVARRTLAVLRMAFLSGAVLELAAALAVALVAIYCGFGLLGLLPFAAPEHFTLASAFFVLVLAPEFYLPMRRLAAAYHEKQLGEAAMAALETLASDAAPVTIAPAPFSGVSLHGLVVAYPGHRVGPLSFTLGTAGLVAITGPTGSGKSSVLSAIAGLLAPAEGSLAGGEGGVAPAVKDIAVCAQHPLLLPGTLAENLALARPAATRAEIAEVAALVGLDAAIATRAGGLDAAIDHRGSGFSGGERKRIGLARALLSGRPLLLLDEPTADLDAASATAITALVADIARSRPVIVATHDPDLVALADLEVPL
jgi:ATP-binding cassette subfamily C protein CydD